MDLFCVCVGFLVGFNACLCAHLTGVRCVFMCLCCAFVWVFELCLLRVYVHVLQVYERI